MKEPGTDLLANYPVAADESQGPLSVLELRFRTGTKQTLYYRDLTSVTLHGGAETLELVFTKHTVLVTGSKLGDAYEWVCAKRRAYLAETLDKEATNDYETRGEESIVRIYVDPPTRTPRGTDASLSGMPF